ncbi:MAG: Npt1/Npt2 family nucleotide transporter [Candidatus Aminicenantaceae bacterium]
MESSRFYRLLSRIVDIRQGEETIVVLLFVYFFLITAPHTIIKAVRYAEILDKFEGIQGLPLGYLLAALVTGLVVVLLSKIQFTIPKQVLSISSLVFFIVTGLIMAYLLPYGDKMLSLILWVWAYVLTVVILAQFWLTVQDVFNPREAKRLIGFLGSGGLLGGVFGGLIAKAFSKPDLAVYSLPLACFLLFLCIFIVRAIYVRIRQLPSSSRTVAAEQKSAEAQKSGFRDSWNTVRKNRYLLLIASIVMMTVIVSTLIDFQFNSIVDISFESKSAKQGFYGLFWAGLTAFAFLVQLLLTSSIIRRFGIQSTLLFAPIILIACSGVFLIFPLALVSAILVKGSEESLAFSLNQSVREILYIPVSSEVRAKAKIFIDLFLNRFAKAIGAVLIFIIMGILSLTGVDLTLAKASEDLALIAGTTGIIVRSLGLAIILLTLLWFALNLKGGRQYVVTVKDNIKLKWARADKDVAEKVDVDYTKLVFDTIESKSRSAALYAMHMYDLLKQDRLTPEIKNLISQKADEVKAASISDMFNAEGAMWFPDVEDDIEQDDFEANIQEILSLDAYQEVMKAHTDQVMEESKKAEVDKMEVAKALGMMDPHAPLVRHLEALIYDDSPEVARYAIESAAKLKRPEHISALINRLAKPLTREDSISALLKYGHEAVGAMNAYLGDHHKDIDLRKALVNALARMGTQEATNVLLRDLDRKASDLDSEIIDALDRIRSENPEINISQNVTKRETLSLIKRYCKTFLELQELKSGKKDIELREQLQKRLNTYFMDTFKLLGLFYPHEDIAKAYQNIERGTKDSTAYAIELLDNTLSKDLRDVLLPLIEDLSSQDRGHRFQNILKNFPKT